MSTTLARLSRLTADPAPAGDGPLLDAFLAGDQSAFALLVRRHAGLVFATCRRILRHHQDAEDAFQATFLVLARRASDVWPREAVASWLFGVAHRVALKARGARNRRMQREEPLEDVACVESQTVDFDLVEAVHRVILKLPEVYRAAVVACDLEGLSRKEAAERLGWSEGTLSGRLSRARALLATRLKRLGFTLPASGLAAFTATDTASAATIESTINLASGAATGASASVTALTEGVVRSMALSKLKAMSAALLTACVLGLGAFAATGAGAGAASGDEPGAQKSPPGDAPPAAQPEELPAKPPLPAAARKRPRPELARRELEVLLQEIDLAALSGKVDKELLDQLRGRLRFIDRLLDPDDQVIDPKQPASTVTDRDRLQGTWRVVSLTEGGKTTPTDPKDPWEVWIVSRTIRMPYLEGGKEWKYREYVFDVNEVPSPRTIDLIAPKKPVGRGIYEFVGGFRTCSSCHDHPFAEKGMPLTTDMWPLCEPARKDPKAMRDAGLRLALTIDGKRPTKFGGEGVIVFHLVRAPAPDGGKPDTDAKARAIVRLQEAQVALTQAEADAYTAQVKLSTAQAEANLAFRKLAAATDRVKVAENALADAGKKPQPVAPAKEGDTFSIHVRTLRDAEKVIRVKATGKQTVLEGLVHAADDVSIKSDAVSVWVVRDEAVLPVDLPAILKGDAKTNHTLKPGDRLFVQAKAGK